MKKINFKLDRPILFFDLETTGLNLANAKIVSLSVLKVFPDGQTEGKSAIVNPEIPIPKEASDVHGITDDIVVGKPSFQKIAKSLHSFMEGCDIGGYNSTNYDVPILCEEFMRVGIEFPNEDVKLIDVCTIFKKMEQRTLTAAYKFYCGKELEDAHTSDADTKATFEVFMSQLEKYEELKGKTIQEIADFCKTDNRVDLAGKVVKNENGDYLYNFGKHNGQKIIDNPSYAQWMLENDFSGNTKSVLRKVLQDYKIRK